MSLVDYDASDEDISASEEENFQAERSKKSLPQVARSKNSPPLEPPLKNKQAESSMIQQQQSSVAPLPSPFEKLPDAALLLNSPQIPLVTGNDHASRVAAAMAQSESRKRDSNGQSSSLTRNKLPRGNLRHPKSIPETAGGMLVPPQLKGRSNVATEDIGKLFVKKQSDSKLRESPPQS